MDLNQELVRTRCEEIEESVERLERIKEVPKAVFLKDRDLQDIACYRLLISIEAGLSLCYHVAAKGLRKVPGEYAECFVILAEAAIIDRDLSERLQRMSRFRNLLVHMYWKMNYETLYKIINTNLNDLRLFSQSIARLV